MACSASTPPWVQGRRRSLSPRPARSRRHRDRRNAALLAEGFVGLQAVDAERGEPLDPERQRALGHGEHGFADLARAGAPARDIREREIGHHRAGRSDLVAVIEMIDVGRVEIHRLLHSAQAERLGEERIVAPGLSAANEVT